MSRRFSYIMGAAWQLARTGALRFGGKPSIYFRIALLIVWKEALSKNCVCQVVWHPNLGQQFCLPEIAVQHPIIRGQLTLPGMSLS